MNDGNQALHSFGDERIERILGKLSPNNILTLLQNPEDAVTRDIPNMVFFNLDLPCNHTLRLSDQGEVVAHCVVRGKGRWRALVEPLQLLKTCVLHYCKFVDFARSQRITASLTPVEAKLLTDYVTILQSQRDFRFSRHYPGFEIVSGFSCVDEEGQTVCIDAVSASIIRVVRENCTLPKEDWVRTISYADEALT